MNWEMRFLHWLKDRHSPRADRLMRTVTRMGDAGGFWIALSAGCVKSDKYRKSGLSMAIALLFSFVFSNTIIKNVVDRARPFWKDKSFNVKIREPRDYSFPSGHTSASIGSAVALFLNRKKEGTAALVLAAQIAFSRLYLLVHYPTDVIAGIILGIAYGYSGNYIAERIMKRLDKRKKQARDLF
ncbi:MAG: phosphatase PAP2 family protein [Clostridia bacterium]|nr:phosphatase PAP2 family protein [[Bacteroides] pectinophilus]MDD5872927.1 phosphatase PAP2 family protein [Clostridia bacterium]